MNIALPPALRNFVDTQVNEGRYLDAGDVVREAVRRMDLATRGTYDHLGAVGGGDIMAMAFLTLMEAAQSAREDLKAIMAGVKAINKEKEGWRSVANEVNKLIAARELGTAVPRGPVSRLRGKAIGVATFSRNVLHFNAPDSTGAVVIGGFTVQSPAQGALTKDDLGHARETIKNKLDRLSEMGEMESLRLQMAMDRQSRMMSTLSNILKKSSEAASSITQNIK